WVSLIVSMNLTLPAAAASELICVGAMVGTRTARRLRASSKSMSSIPPEPDQLPPLSHRRGVWLRRYAQLLVAVVVAVVAASLISSFAVWAAERYDVVNVSALVPATGASDLVALALLAMVS